MSKPVEVVILEPHRLISAYGANVLDASRVTDTWIEEDVIEFHQAPVALPHPQGATNIGDDRTPATIRLVIVGQHRDGRKAIPAQYVQWPDVAQ
jgi:hypothetical protein